MKNRHLEEAAAAGSVEKDSEVREELERRTAEATTKKQRPKGEKRAKFGLAVYLLLLIALGTLYYFLRIGYFGFAEAYRPLLARVVVGAMAVVVVLTISGVIRAYLIDQLSDGAARYNLSRVVSLLAGLSISFICLSVLFANWYTAVVSLGLISLILGFALQTPITSFIGWLYILVKAPYKVGDRIKIGEAAGDVIGVSYLDTTLWEFGGELLSTANHPSGRLIKFPNSMVLDSVVHNYSWPLFPYIWNDIKFYVAYQSDLDFVANVMRETAVAEVGDSMGERIQVYRRLLADTPVDELEVREHPVVNFRVHDNTWIEAIVRYLVEPRRAGYVKSRLIKTMLERLNAEPEKVMFPKGDMR